MALGDFPYPTNNLALAYIAAGLYNGQEQLEHCCLNQYVIPSGLSATYCPGNDAFERKANLQADKRQSYFKGYNPPVPSSGLSGGSHSFSTTPAKLDDYTLPYLCRTITLSDILGTYDGIHGDHVEYVKVTSITESQPDTLKVQHDGVSYNRNSTFPFYMYSPDGSTLINNLLFLLLDYSNYLNWALDYYGNYSSNLNVTSRLKFRGNPHESSPEHSLILRVVVVI